jgi:hypothetical protein
MKESCTEFGGHFSAIKKIFTFFIIYLEKLNSQNGSCCGEVSSQKKYWSVIDHFHDEKIKFPFLKGIIYFHGNS